MSFCDRLQVKQIASFMMANLNANVLVIAAAPASLAALIVTISTRPGTPSPAIFDTILSIINLLLHYIWTGDPGSQSAVK